MGFKFNKVVEKEYIDHDHLGKPFYHQEIRMTGNSITDTICIEQDGQVIGMSLTQFTELVESIYNSSLWSYAGFDKLTKEK